MFLMWLIVPFALVFLIGLLAILYIMYKDRALMSIPGPPPVPFFGNKTPKNGEEIRDLIVRNVARYGETSRLYLGPLLRIVTCDVEVLEYIMKSNVHLQKSKLYEIFREWLGNGLITSSGEDWRKMRKILTPTLHFSILTDFLVSMNETSKCFVKKLLKYEGKPIDILAFTQQYSMDIIAETLMNIKLKTLENGNTTYLDACNQYLKLQFHRAFRFWQHIPILFRMFSENAEKLAKALKILHSTSRGIIAEKTNEWKANVEENDVDEFGIKRKQALVDTLFKYRTKAGLSDEQIQAEVDSFMFAGFDTVSRALAFGLYDLAANPNVQKRLHDEIVSTFGNDTDDFTQNQINQLAYLDMVVKEILRLHSPVPLIERVLEEDATIGTRFYPKGTCFIMALRELSMNPKVFPDPEKFDPERFSPENAENIPNFAYVPFSAGARNCIGQKFALMEVKLGLVHLLRELEFFPVPGHKLNLVYDGLLDSSTGILVRVNKRRN